VRFTSARRPPASSPMPSATIQVRWRPREMAPLGSEAAAHRQARKPSRVPPSPPKAVLNEHIGPQVGPVVDSVTAPAPGGPSTAAKRQN